MDKVRCFGGFRSPGCSGLQALAFRTVSKSIVYCRSRSQVSHSESVPGSVTEVSTRLASRGVSDSKLSHNDRVLHIMSQTYRTLPALRSASTQEGLAQTKPCPQKLHPGQVPAPPPGPHRWRRSVRTRGNFLLLSPHQACSSFPEMSHRGKGQARHGPQRTLSGSFSHCSIGAEKHKLAPINELILLYLGHAIM
jgi:hypothetical protein